MYGVTVLPVLFILLILFDFYYFLYTQLDVENFIKLQDFILFPTHLLIYFYHPGKHSKAVFDF